MSRIARIVTLGLMAGKAIEIFKTCEADGWVEKAKRRLAEIA